MPYTLAAQTRQRQAEAIRRSDRVADQAERAVHAWWRELLALLRSAPQLGLFRLHQAALAHYRRLPVVTGAALRDGLTGLYVWGAESARRGVLRAVPRKTLQAVAVRRIRSGRVHRVTESVGNVALLEREPPFPNPLDFLFSNPLADFLHDPDSIPDDLLAKLLLPTPVRYIIQGRVDRLIAPFLAAPRPDLVPPGLFASELVNSYSQGKTLQEIAKELLPIADGVRTSARRVARTWGTAIAQDSQMEVHESLGSELVIGYTLYSVLGANSRQWHKDRHLTTYYRNPGPGQKGFHQMPNPPREPADASERPAGTPWISWN